MTEKSLCQKVRRRLAKINPYLGLVKTRDCSYEWWEYGKYYIVDHTISQAVETNIKLCEFIAELDSGWGKE